MEKHRRSHKWAFPLGLILTALAVVGAVTLVRMAVNGIQNQLSNQEEYQRYEEFLSKIIVHDPDPFDSVASVPLANISQLLDISIWSILKGDDATPENLPQDDEGNMLIDQEKVAAEFEKLFGERPPKHASIEGSDFEFIYDPETKVYRVPVTGALNIYSPRVIDAKKTGSNIELTVEYLAFNDFKLDSRGYRIEPVDAAKTMLITLFVQPDESFRVGAIRQATGKDYVPVGETKIA